MTTTTITSEVVPGHVDVTRLAVTRGELEMSVRYLEVAGTPRLLSLVGSARSPRSASTR